MKSLLFISSLFLIIPCASAHSSETPQQIYLQFAGDCEFSETKGHDQVAECMTKALQLMKIRLSAEYKKALANAEGAAAFGDHAGKTGAEIAREKSGMMWSQLKKHGRPTTKLNVAKS